MPPRRGPYACALLATLFAASAVSAQIPPPLAPPPPPPGVPGAQPMGPPVVHPVPPAAAPSDPLTDLMNRVNNLEGELKKEKERALAKAAEVGKKPTIAWNVQLQADGVWSGQNTASREAAGVIPDGAAFRRARFNAGGDYGPWIYKFGMDFALSGRPSFIDVFLGLTDVPYLGTVRVGHFFEPLGLEYYS